MRGRVHSRSRSEAYLFYHRVFMDNGRMRGLCVREHMGGWVGGGRVGPGWMDGRVVWQAGKFGLQECLNQNGM